MLLNSSNYINHFYFSEEDIDDEDENDATDTMKKVNCHPLCSFITLFGLFVLFEITVQ